MTEERKDGTAYPEPLGMKAKVQEPSAPKYVVFDRAAFVQWWQQSTVGGTQHAIPMPGEIMDAEVTVP